MIFDPHISLGTILTGIVIIMSFVAGSFRLLAKINAMSDKADDTARKMERYIERSDDMHDKVITLAVDVVRQDERIKILEAVPRARRATDG